MVKLVANPDNGCCAVANLLFLVAPFAKYLVFGTEPVGKRSRCGGHRSRVGALLDA